MSAKPLSQVPRLKATIREFRDDRLGLLERVNRECGDIGKFRGVAGSVIIVNTPDLVHEVLVEKARCFEKSPVLRSSLFPLVGQGLFTSEGELWRRQRKLLAPIFQQAQIQKFAESMIACTERAADGWADGAVVDMARETTHITMSIAGKTLFDADTFSDADELGEALTVALSWAGDMAGNWPLVIQARLRTFLQHLPEGLPPRVKRLRDRAAEALLRPILWPTRRTRELRRALAVLERRVARMIAERRADPAGRQDLLSHLLAARDEGDGGGAMSDRQVRDEVLTLFVAGHETTATALAWALMLLCQHPAAYARVRAEIDALGRAPGSADLGRVPYCLQVFKESMRLYPPVYLFGRQAIVDVEIGGYHMPRGTIVLVSPYSLQRKPSLWPDPERFDPERFTQQNEAARHRSAYIPLSAGPRTCIGNHFALMEGPIVLGTLFHMADFDLVDPHGTTPDPSATLRPRGQVSMRVRRREAVAERAASRSA